MFNTDLLHVQQYLFNRLKIEPTSKVKVEYDGSKLLEVVKVDDEDDVNPLPFSLLYLDLYTYSGIVASDDAIRVIKVRYEQNEVVFDNNKEKIILQQSPIIFKRKTPTLLFAWAIMIMAKYFGIYWLEDLICSLEESVSTVATENDIFWSVWFCWINRTSEIWFSFFKFGC